MGLATRTTAPLLLLVLGCSCHLVLPLGEEASDKDQRAEATPQDAASTDRSAASDRHPENGLFDLSHVDTPRSDGPASDGLALPDKLPFSDEASPDQTRPADQSPDDGPATADATRPGDQAADDGPAAATDSTSTDSTSPCACPVGTRCSGGQCLCDTTSGCAGCCQGNTCVALADEKPAICGFGGNPCGSCVDSKVCTIDECDTSTGMCTYFILAGASCPNTGSACDEGQCQANGDCKAVPKNCPLITGKPCTVCGVSGGCVTAPDLAPCKTNTGDPGRCAGTTCCTGCIAAGICVSSGANNALACGIGGVDCKNCALALDLCCDGICSKACTN